MNMNIKKVLCTLTIILLVFACKKDRNIDPDKEDPDTSTPVNIDLKVAKVTLPTGSTYSLAGHELMSFGVIQPVATDGSTKTANIEGAINIAQLFDKDNNPIMMGFVTDESATISAESTAKVLLYYALGTAFQADTVKQFFLEKIDQEPRVSQWINGFVEQWKANPKLLAGYSHIASLDAFMKEFIDSSPTKNLRTGELKMGTTRTSDITVDVTDVRSGIQVSPLDGELSKIKITNRYRRRAYAFVYKTGYKVQTPQGLKYEEIISPKIPESQVADMDLLINPASGMTSVTGSLIKSAQGKGIDFAVVDNGPLTLELKDTEEEAIYKVRVVGAGNRKGSTSMTKAEADKVKRLILETFALDFLMPGIGMGIGKMDEADKNKYIEAVDALLKVLPGVYDELNKGDFAAAFWSVVETAGSELGNKAFEEMFKYLANKVASGEGAKELAKKATNGLKALDMAMQAGDWGRIGGEFLVSSQLDEWVVTARASKVRLKPKESAIVVGGASQEIEADIVNLDEAQANGLRFEWSTDGKYGYIQDTKNNSGNSFENDLTKVRYRTNVSATQLSDGDNWENIYVKAYLGTELIGLDTAKINVRKASYIIKPFGITLTGKKIEGYSDDKLSSTKVTLYLDPVNSSIKPLYAYTDREFKIIWTTPGKHGGLSTAERPGIPRKSLTLYEDEEVTYECTDDVTRTGREEIWVRIYSRERGTDGDYEFFDEVKGSIDINNDPKKRIIYLPGKAVQGHKIFKEEPLYDRYGQLHYSARGYSGNIASFKPEPDDAHYSVTFIYQNSTYGVGSWRVGQDLSGWGSGYGPAEVWFDGSTYYPADIGSWYVAPWYPGEPKPKEYNLENNPGSICRVTITLK